MFRIAIFLISGLIISHTASAQTYKQGEYKTSDGKSFLNAEEARRHQNSIDAGTIQQSIIGKSQEAAAEKEKQKMKQAKNDADAASFRQEQRQDNSNTASREFNKARNNQPLDLGAAGKLSTAFPEYAGSSDYLKAIYVLSLVKPLALPSDFNDVVNRGGLFSSSLKEEEVQLIIKGILKNTESVQIFGVTDEGAEKVFQHYQEENTPFCNEMLPRLMAYLKRRSQDYSYKAGAGKVKCPAGIKWLKDNGISTERNAFTELKEEIKGTLKINDGISEYGIEKPKRVLDQIEKSGYTLGSDPEMELLRGIALYRMRKYPEAGKAFGMGWPFYQEHKSELSLTFPITAMRCLGFDAKFNYAAEAYKTYFNVYPEWNTLAGYVSMLILDGQENKAEEEFDRGSLVLKSKSEKSSYSMGTKKDTRELMDACIYFYNKKYKKAANIFKENKWLEAENYFYWIMYRISARVINDKAPILMVDARDCTRPAWIEQETWDLGRND